MLKFNIQTVTSSSLKFTLVETVTFSSAELWMSMADSSSVIMDIFTASTSVSERGILLINNTTSEFTINLNNIQSDNIYYKKFFVIFKDASGTEISRTLMISIAPSGNPALYGVVNKLSTDFNKMAKLSGVTLRVFIPNLLKARCPLCWDEELQQVISSVCSCTADDASGAFNPIDIPARKVKTASKQIYQDIGTSTKESAQYTTYARIDFSKGVLIVDLSDMKIYEVGDRSIAHIGGIRTSTNMELKLIKNTDARVAIILKLL